MTELSVTIITKNEEHNIERCLQSVACADEIVVLDSGSTDATVEICKKYTDKIYQTDWPGFGKQKNRAIAKATKTWVLSLDADETISPQLAQEIKQVIQEENEVVAYKLPRRLIFLEREIKYANGKDFNIRLFKRDNGKFTDAIVHEKIIIDGPSSHLRQYIYHYSFANIGDLVARMNSYTDLVAEQRKQQQRKANLTKAFTHAVWMFIRVYFLRAGFLDGGPGFILSVSFAEGAFYRYAKLKYS